MQTIMYHCYVCRNLCILSECFGKSKQDCIDTYMDNVKYLMGQGLLEKIPEGIEFHFVKETVH